MKKFLTFTAILLCSAIGVTAHTESDSIQIKTDSILINIENLVESSYTLLKQESLKQRYKLYPTENIYTFLQLDTQTGAIQQVQWSLDSNKEFWLCGKSPWCIVLQESSIAEEFVPLQYGKGNRYLQDICATGSTE
jgi:hypothetical protein